MVSLGFGVGVVPKIVLDNSPVKNNITILDIKPSLESYNIGMFALRKSLKNPLVMAFWEIS
jgi:LysR family positive regulator for ilvC